MEMQVIGINGKKPKETDTQRELSEDLLIHAYERITLPYDDERAKSKALAHEYIEVGVVTQGNGVHCIDGNTVPCKSGDIYVVPPGISHEYFLLCPGDELIVRKLLFKPQDWFHGEAVLGGSKHYCYGVFNDGGAVAYAMLNARMNEKINGIMDDIESELSDKEEDWKTLVFTYLVWLLSYLSRYINRSVKNSYKKTKDWEVASLAMKIVEEEFSDHEISLESVAARVFVSPSKLSRVFKAEVGQLFSEYLRDVRLNYAARLLKETELSVEQIFSRCGIYGISSFYRNFREAFGMTPQIYKQLNQISTKKQETNESEKESVKMEILREISENVQKGKSKIVKELVLKAIDEGAVIEEILNDGLLAGMGVIGEKFKNNEVFVPEVLVAARAMNMGAELLKPLLAKSGITVKGRVCIGTVQGDLHDIGKNLVKMMMESKGLEVVDLGTDVPAETFVKTAIEQNCDVICCSALLTTTMHVMADVVKAAEAEGIRGKVKIMIGGAPVSQEYCDKIGADSYSTDAASAADTALEFCKA